MGSLNKEITFDYSKFDLTHKPSDSKTLQYSSIGQLIARARIEKKPLVVVEGKDDITVYEQFVRQASLKASVRAVETIPGYNEGCVHVKKFIENAQDEIKKSDINEKFLLGIIDRDASFYRGENLDMKCLFVLNSYSFESHFITKEHIEYALGNFLSSSFGINEEVVDHVLSDFYNTFEKLYYISLEALKNACIQPYSGLIGFGASYGQIKKNEEKIKQILLKKDELDAFASSLNIISFQDKKAMIKGKWLLDAFIDSTFKQIKALSDRCTTNTLVQGQERCDFCSSGATDKCAWKPKKHYTHLMLKSLILQYNMEAETSYIIEELKKLG